MINNEDVGNLGDSSPDLEWETQNFEPAIFITLARIYDLLSVIAIRTSPLEARAILKMHEEGKLYGVEPFLVPPNS